MFYNFIYMKFWKRQNDGIRNCLVSFTMKNWRGWAM